MSASERGEQREGGEKIVSRLLAVSMGLELRNCEIIVEWKSRVPCLID